MTIVKSVEKIEFTITAGTLTNTGTLTKGQIDSKCVPFTTISTPVNTFETFDSRFCKVTISGTTVTATRDQAENFEVLLVIFVVEYTNECTVQTGEMSFGASTELNITIPALTSLTRTFLYFQWNTASTTSNFNDSFVKGVITDTTTLTFIKGTSSFDATVRWYTVECNGTQFDVQRGSFLLDGTLNNAQSAAFTAVDMTRTMTIASYNTNDPIDDPTIVCCTVDLVDSTHVRATRSANRTPPSPGEIDLNFQVIQFEASQVISVQRGKFEIILITGFLEINEVNLDVSMAHSPCGQSNADIDAGDGSGDIGVIFCRLDFIDSEFIRGRVGGIVLSDDEDVNIASEAIEFVVLPPIPTKKVTANLCVTTGVRKDLCVTGSIKNNLCVTDGIKKDLCV
jgi:hypothetical protein